MSVLNTHAIKLLKSLLAQKMFGLSIFEYISSTMYVDSLFSERIFFCWDTKMILNFLIYCSQKFKHQRKTEILTYGQ